MKISLHTFGCKLNQAESDELKKNLIKSGFFIVPLEYGEDIAIVRACAVTCGASQTVREMIRRLKRAGVYVIAVGCLENKEMEEIDFVAKSNKEVVKQLVILSKTKNPLNSDVKGSFANAQDDNIPRLDLPTKSGSGMTSMNRTTIETKTETKNRTRAFIKIQTGCNFNCAYCVIPSFRGQSQSIAPEKIIKKILEAEKEGYQETILTGVNICQYRGNTPSQSPPQRGGDKSNPSSLRRGVGGGVHSQIDLAELLKKILNQTKIPRIRLGSLDPRLITDKLIKAYNTPSYLPLKEGETICERRLKKGKTNRLLPHWHLSLQSGSDEILKKMNRLYTAKKYLDIVKKLRKNNPLFSITTDIIVGFPGETEENFTTTCELVPQAQFSKVHIFPFSPRPGTMAAKMPSQIQDKIKTERARTLKKITETVAENYAKQFIGKTVEVLFENKKSGVSSGYTPEYLQVKYRSNKNLTNKIIAIKY